MKKLFIMSITLIVLFNSLSLTSCKTTNNTSNTINNRENLPPGTITTMIGRVVIFSGSPQGIVGFSNVNNINYAVYPESIADEFRALQGYLIEFTVIIVDVKTYPSILMSGGAVTPISWRIIEE